MGLLKKNASPNVDAMRETAEALGIELSNDESPSAMIADLRAAFDTRLKDVPEVDHIVCAKCGERTDDDPAITRCPFCGDEGADEEEAASLEAADEETDGEETETEETPAIEGADLDPGVDSEEPPTVDLEAASEPEPEPVPEKPKKGRKKTEKATKTKPAADKPPKKKTEKAAEPAALAPAEPSDLAAALAVEDKKIETAQRDIVTGSYDLGVALREVHSKDLWKAAGFKTFPQYLTSKGIGRTFAYDLMELTSKFDRKTFEEVGRKKLMLVSRAGGPESEKGKDILDKAKSGASVRGLEAEAKGKSEGGKSEGGSGRKAHEVQAHERGGKKDETAPPKDNRITLLAKVGAKPATAPFLDRKTRQPVKAWAPETFAEVKIAEDVSMFLTLKLDKEGKPAGVTYAFKRAEPTEAAAE